VAAAAAHVATLCRRVTPLRALLDLTEMDAWAAYQAAVAWARACRALPPPVFDLASGFAAAARDAGVWCAGGLLALGRGAMAHGLCGGG
jgi:hypothetical protein